MPSLYAGDSHTMSYGCFLAQGKQSRIYLAPTIIKVIGTGKSLTQNEANALARQLCNYRAVLQRQGWLLPELYSIRVHQYGHESELIMQEQYIDGSSLTKMIVDQGMARAIQCLLPIVKLLCLQPTVKQTYYGKTFHRLNYGVDLKPDNLVFNSVTNGLFLVDTFAPKTMTPVGSWCCYNKKLESLSPRKLLVVTATRAGILLRLTRLMGLQETGQEHSAMLSLLKSAGMERDELRFIAREVSAGYPLLDHMYQ